MEYTTFEFNTVLWEIEPNHLIVCIPFWQLASEAKLANEMAKLSVQQLKLKQKKAKGKSVGNKVAINAGKSKES